jgi:hypothetical protein
MRPCGSAEAIYTRGPSNAANISTKETVAAFNPTERRKGKTIIRVRP